MLRRLFAIFLITCILAGNLCAGVDSHASGPHGADECSISSVCAMDAHPCHNDTTSSNKEHCCDTHSHLPAVTVQQARFYYQLHEKQFTAVIPHFSPSEHLQERFIPPRHTA